MTSGMNTPSTPNDEYSGTQTPTRTTQEIINELNYMVLDNHYDNEIMPHYGLVPDWKPRYDRLVTITRELIKSIRGDDYRHRYDNSSPPDIINQPDGE